MELEIVIKKQKETLLAYFGVVIPREGERIDIEIKDVKLTLIVKKVTHCFFMYRGSLKPYVVLEVE